MMWPCSYMHYVSLDDYMMEVLLDMNEVVFTYYVDV